jgi:hypothetical protein
MDIVVREVREVRPKSRSGTRRFRRVLVARARARARVSVLAAVCSCVCVSLGVCVRVCKPRCVHACEARGGAAAVPGDDRVRSASVGRGAAVGHARRIKCAAGAPLHSADRSLARTRTQAHARARRHVHAGARTQARAQAHARAHRRAHTGAPTACARRRAHTGTALTAEPIWGATRTSLWSIVTRTAADVHR